MWLETLHNSVIRMNGVGTKLRNHSKSLPHWVWCFKTKNYVNQSTGRQRWMFFTFYIDNNSMCLRTKNYVQKHRAHNTLAIDSFPQTLGPLNAQLPSFPKWNIGPTVCLPWFPLPQNTGPTICWPLSIPCNTGLTVRSVRNWDFFSLARGTVGLNNSM